jgi:elongation factor Ts
MAFIMEISAKVVKAFRDKTGLPMMECKKALIEAQGDEEKAIEILRKAGAKTMAARTDRETEAGRIALYTCVAQGVTALVELLCESAPVSNTDEFIELVGAIAEQLATGPGAATVEELLAQTFPGKDFTLQFAYDELVNKIREVFRLTRFIRIEGPCGAYLHHNSATGALLPLEGDNVELGKDIGMHVVSMKPHALSENELDPALVQREREMIIQEVQEQSKGKPENVIQKIVEGKMKAFLSERTLLGQPFVKDATKTVAQVCEEGGIKIKDMIHWVLGQS